MHAIVLYEEDIVVDKVVAKSQKQTLVTIKVTITDGQKQRLARAYKNIEAITLGLKHRALT